MGLNKKKKLGVVCSGGGNRTTFALGVLYKLMEEGYNVKHITSTSGGIQYFYYI